jgi:hypothetical protein
MSAASAQREASKLINWGYRKTSNNHRLIARIDRPDWYRHMAQQHSPWDPNGQGIDWVFKMGSASAGDHYRRCYSRDFKTVSHMVLALIPSSDHDDCGYCRKKDEPQSWDVCRGDIPMASKKEIMYPEDLRGKYKIHSMNVVTGRSQSSANTFHDSYDDALAKAKSIVQRDSDIQMVILKCTHVVQSSGPPVEVIDLDD